MALIAVGAFVTLAVGAIFLVRALGQQGPRFEPGEVVSAEPDRQDDPFEDGTYDDREEEGGLPAPPETTRAEPQAGGAMKPSGAFDPPLSAGQCLATAPEDSPDVEVVPCTKEHRAEVLGVVEAPPGAKLPGRFEADYWCYQQGRDLSTLWGVGMQLETRQLTASRAEWDKGNRWLACVGTYDPGIAPLTSSFEKLGGGGVPELVPRGTLYVRSELPKTGQCLEFLMPRLTGSAGAVDCKSPHQMQILGQATLRATTAPQAASEAKRTCDAMFTKLNLIERQAAELRAVPYYNDPGSDGADGTLACALVQWGGREIVGDARDGAVWRQIDRK